MAAATKFFSSNYEIAYQMGLLDTLTLLYSQIIDPAAPACGSTRRLHTDNISKTALIFMLEDTMPRSLEAAVRIRKSKSVPSLAAGGVMRSATLSQRAIEEVVNTPGTLTDFVVCKTAEEGYQWFFASLFRTPPLILANDDDTASTCDLLESHPTMKKAIREAKTFITTKVQPICQHSSSSIAVPSRPLPPLTFASSSRNTNNVLITHSLSGNVMTIRAQWTGPQPKSSQPSMAIAQHLLIMVFEYVNSLKFNDALLFHHRIDGAACAVVAMINVNL